jgi:hypothetical protein
MKQPWILWTDETLRKPLNFSKALNILHASNHHIRKQRRNFSMFITQKSG